MTAKTIIARTVIGTALGALMLGAASVEAHAQSRRPANGYALKEPTTPEEIAATRPNPQAPGFRVPLPPLERMDPAMREDFEFNAKRLKTPVPPTAPLMLTPDIKANVSRVLGPVGRSGLPEDLKELAIIIVARHWGAQIEWYVHAPQTVLEGVPAEAVEALRTGKRPRFATPGQEATYKYLVELLRDHRISDATYEELRKILGTEQLVALTELAGYYGRLAMTLIAHNVPLRGDIEPPLPPLARAFP